MSSPKRTIPLALNVTAEAGLDPNRVCDLVARIIASGQEDAQASTGLDLDDDALADADHAAALEFSTPVLSALDPQILQALMQAKIALRDLAGIAADIADMSPGLTDEINEPWNEGGVGYEAIRALNAVLDPLLAKQRSGPSM